jgi:hypothetical protein
MTSAKLTCSAQKTPDKEIGEKQIARNDKIKEQSIVSKDIRRYRV